jgi:branched-chain amino acid transport system permease protein
VLLPVFLNIMMHSSIGPFVGSNLTANLTANLEPVIFGGLINFFLIVEPQGIARLRQIAKEKLRPWPFPH